MATSTKRQDNFPNYMSFIVTTSGTNVFTSFRINTPIPRSQVVSGNRATVMELLWVEWQPTFESLLDAFEESMQYGIFLGTPTVHEEISNPQSLISGELILLGLTAGGNMQAFPLRHNLQSADGYGFLLASDSFSAWLDSDGLAGTFSGHFRVYYRFVNIPVTEYIGLVQSQSTSNN